MDQALFEILLDNSPDGIYVLDHQGNYIYANSIYINMLNLTKAQLLTYNVHDFLTSGQIDICISDIVYKEKRSVNLFQDLYDRHDSSQRKHRQLVVSNPVFDENGEVCNIIAFVRPLDTMNDAYHQASMQQSVTAFTQKEKPDGSIIAESPAIKEILALCSNIADIDSSILITGESGTGKEVISSFIHTSSSRSKKNMVVINCASLPPSLLEAELFGYEKGAFTGASSSKAGLFEAADGSTLFLDEINSLPFDLQGKLLRAIETKNIQRIGSTKPRKVDFRLLAATNEDLAELVAEKNFRADLYYRLNVIPIDIPPLRKRREDIVPMALHFLNHYCKKYNKNKVFSQRTLALIEQFDWPGNVRELKNFVERSIIMSSGDFIEIKNIGGIMQGNFDTAKEISASPALLKDAEEVPPAADLKGFDYAQMIKDHISLEEHVGTCESDYVRYALDIYESSYLAAKALRTSQTSIIRKKKKYDL
ncbi:sigma-54 interaction domain-containing protein [Lacrimispora sp.]|uniref:sigma-54 interaction domain-containing protein n=1 Tax=Lacrimispora sp. TaxID=2719234 RepID=UPI0028984F00|nr:sigma 54-interacting transcriptional regulator [Lacrimispora sp.]